MLRDVERRILECLVKSGGKAHREKIVGEVADPESNIGRGHVNGSNGGIPRLMGSWSARIEYIGLIRTKRRSDGRYKCHEITDAGRQALLPPEPSPPKHLPAQIRSITVAQFHAYLRGQGVAREDLAFVCPMCGTVQSARDLIAAGAGATFNEVEKYLAFSCVGRWTDGGPPRQKPDGKPCDWTLGGLFKIHKLEVVSEDGESHPRFELARPAQAKAHAENMKGATAKPTR